MSKTEAKMLSDMELEAFFAAGRSEAPVPSEALLARVMADADAEIAARARSARKPARKTGLWAAALGALGGWPALAGMATATVAGVWIGFVSPDQLDALSGGLLLPGESAGSVSYELEDLLPSYGGLDSFYEEG